MANRLREAKVTRKQVKKLFEEVERASLLSLPSDRFANFTEAQRKVSRDGHFSVDKSYYSVPPEYLGHTLWIRWDSRLVRVYNDRMHLICSHAKQPEGKSSTHQKHIASEKISPVERGAKWLLLKTSEIGPQTKAWTLIDFKSHSSTCHSSHRLYQIAFSCKSDSGDTFSLLSSTSSLDIVSAFPLIISFFEFTQSTSSVF